jgi:molecular chaperone GrpE
MARGAGKREGADGPPGESSEPTLAEAVWETEGGAPTGVGAPRAGEPEPSPPPPPPEEAIDFRDRWLRAEAELQNYKRRTQRDAEEVRRRAEERVLLDLAALLDDLERALAAAAEGGANPPWVEGVGLVLQKGRDYLARHGIAIVDPLGQRFDPNHHEAILEVEAAEGVAAGTVAQVVQKGYRRGDRSLRAARVVVARARRES